MPLRLCNHMRVHWTGCDGYYAYFHCKDCGADLAAEVIAEAEA